MQCIETANGSHPLLSCFCKICMFSSQLGLHEVSDIYQFLYVNCGNLGATLLLQILNVGVSLNISLFENLFYII